MNSATVKTDRKNLLSNMQIFTGNILKIIAAVSMTLDHIGLQILNDFELFRIFGRIAFPIFAYMIAEGCRYTKKRKNYLFNMLFLAFVCQLVYFIALGSLSQCVLVTFSLSIWLIYRLDNACYNKNAKNIALLLFTFFIIVFLTNVLPIILHNTDYYIDYGLSGVLLPVFVYLGADKKQKLLLCFVGLIILSLSLGSIQWYCLISLIFIAMYNGKRGKANMKNFFYIYYPLHLAIIYLLSLII